MLFFLVGCQSGILLEKDDEPIVHEPLFFYTIQTQEEKDDEVIIHEYCRNLYPLAMPESGWWYYPNMDDRVLLATARAFRNYNSKVHGDMAAIIVRHNRYIGLQQPITIPLSINSGSDAFRFFSGRFQHEWRFRSDGQVLLAQVSDWIIENRFLFDSVLLDEEIEKIQLVKDRLYRWDNSDNNSNE